MIANRGRWASLAALGLSAAAAVAAWTVAVRIEERLPHLEDEFAYLWEANVMAQGRIALPSPPEPRSYLVPFVVDFEGHRFGKYPPGWPAVLSLAIRAGEAWLLNPLLAGACVWLIYRLACKIAGHAIGVLAAALSASSPVFLLLGGTLMPHMFSLFLSLALTLAWLDLWLPAEGGSARVPAPILLPVVGLSLGLLALTRPLTALAVAVPFAIHGGILFLRGRARARIRLAWIAGLALVVAAILPLWQAALTGNPSLNPYTLWWAYDRVGFGPEIGRAEGGHTLAQARLNARISLDVAQHDLFGWPFLSFLFLPFGVWALRRVRAMWLVAALIPCLIGAHLFYWVGTWLFGPRYYFEGLPAAAILSAAGIAWVAGWHKAAGGWGPTLRAALVAGAVVGLAALNGHFYLPDRLNSLRGLYGITAAKREAFAAHAPSHALVIVHPASSWTDYGTLLTLEPPYCACDLVLVYSRGPRIDALAAAAYPDRRLYHYYSDEPGVFWPEPRVR